MDSPPGIPHQNVIQNIKYTGPDSEFSTKIVGHNVTVQCNSGQHTHGSSKVKLINRIDYNWEFNYYRGQLVAVHINGKIVAYGMKGKDGGMVRVTNQDSGDRALIKNLKNDVKDVAFSFSRQQVVLGCIDDEGNVMVYEIHDRAGAISYTHLLHIFHSDVSLYSSPNFRIIWCPYIAGFEEESSEDLQDDPEKMFVVLNGNKAEIWNYGLINKKYGNGPIKPNENYEGYVEINHSSELVDASFSSDGTAIAIACDDGYVKFFQIYMIDNEKQKCLHEWRPHDGKPLSSIIFADNLLECSSQCWKFTITGANHNSELKLWSCETWTCLQTIQFKPDPMNLIDTIYLKMSIDYTGQYLVLFDLNNKVLYVLQLKRNDEAQQISVTMLSQFLLPTAFLSFHITEARCQKLRSLDIISSDDYDNDVDLDDQDDTDLEDENDEEDEDDEDCDDGLRRLKQRRQAVVVKMLVIQQKKFQECNVVFQPESMLFNSEVIYQDVMGEDEIILEIEDEVDRAGQQQMLKLMNNNSSSKNDAGAGEENDEEEIEDEKEDDQDDDMAVQNGKVPKLDDLQSSVTLLIQQQQAAHQQQQQQQPQATLTLMTPEAFTASSNIDVDVELTRQANSRQNSNRNSLGKEGNTFSKSKLDVKEQQQQQQQPQPEGEPASQAAATAGEAIAAVAPADISTTVDNDDSICDNLIDFRQRPEKDIENNTTSANNSSNNNNFASGGSSPSREVQEILSLNNSNASNNAAPSSYSSGGNIVGGGGGGTSTTITGPSQNFYDRLSNTIKQRLEEVAGADQQMIPPKEFGDGGGGVVDGSILASGDLTSWLNMPSLVNKGAVASDANVADSKKIKVENDSNSSTSSSLIGQQQPELRLGGGDDLNNSNASSSAAAAAMATSAVDSQFARAQFEMLNARLTTLQSALNDHNLIAHKIHQELQTARQKAVEYNQQQLQLQQQQQLVQQQKEQQEQQQKTIAYAAMNQKLLQDLDVALSKQQLGIAKMLENMVQLQKSGERTENDKMRTSLSEIVTMAGADVCDRVQQTVQHETKNSVVPALKSTLEALTKQLEAQNVQRMQTDAALQENISKMINSKALAESLSSSVSNLVAPILEKCYRDMIASTLVPSWEKVCGKMFLQINETFVQGTKEYTASVENYMDRQRKVQEKGNHLITQMQTVSENLQRNVDKLTGTLSAEVQQQFITSLKHMQDNVIQSIRDVVSEQVTTGFKQHASALEDSVMNAVSRSRAVTPSPHSTSAAEAQVSLVHIDHLIYREAYDEAFQLALSAENLNYVIHVCSKVDIGHIFSNQCTLPQNCVLALIQQLSMELHKNTELKLSYIRAALVALNTDHPATRQFIPKVLKDLSKQLQIFMSNISPTSKFIMEAKLLKMAVEGILDK